jgi:hypothetical protein
MNGKIDGRKKAFFQKKIPYPRERVDLNSDGELIELDI